ncbi:6599_t:CDS:1 [Ambispora gerdemannii]|uniref:6599_t:CDS:1 n=1 Tax=Ambispora gerdemannii TaxID=144530 RepID=A0A9N9AYI8_9GLOM|nr:6599_t:CDS:1 [Ambispora gerdemannii]
MISKVFFLIVVILSTNVLSIPIIITPTHFEKRVAPFSILPSLFGPAAQKFEKIFFVDNNFAKSSHGFFGPTSVADSAKKAHVTAFDNAFIKRDHSVAHPLSFFGPEAQKLEKIVFADNVFGASNSHGIFGPSSIADSAKKAKVVAFDDAFI